MSFKLKPFQEDGVRAIAAARGRALLADEMGLGKTAQALSYAVRARTWPLVVVCPAIAKYTWQQEASSIFGLRSYVCEGQRPEPPVLSQMPKIIIVNYEILEYWLPTILNLNPVAVFIDECQYISNPAIKRTANVVRLCMNRDTLIGISGTPLTNRPIELFTILKLLWPKEFPSLTEYGMRYCRAELVRGKIEYRGANHLDELHTRLKDLGMIRRLKKDVLKELPDKTRHIIPLPIDDSDGQYKQVNGEFMTWMSSLARLRGIRGYGNAGLKKVGELKRLAARKRYNASVEWVDNLLEETDDKVILFAWHRKCIEALERRYHGKCVVIDGSTSAKDRHNAVKLFQTNDKYKVFIGNLQAASTNITLTASSRVVMMELDWRPGIHLQAEDRPHRIGQKSAVDIYYLVGKDTIEVKICNLLQTKQRNISKILDGTGDNDFTIANDLFRLLEKEAHATPSK